jgi:hypothetical protein
MWDYISDLDPYALDYPVCTADETDLVRLILVRRSWCLCFLAIGA